MNVEPRTCNYVIQAPIPPQEYYTVLVLIHNLSPSSPDRPEVQTLLFEVDEIGRICSEGADRVPAVGFLTLLASRDLTDLWVQLPSDDKDRDLMYTVSNLKGPFVAPPPRTLLGVK